MKERGIPMTGTNIAPIQADIKTHTRRIMKFQPPDQLQESPYIYTASLTRSGSKPVTVASWGDGACICPYGNVGDRLWVREAWRAPKIYDSLPPRDIPPETDIEYLANGMDALHGRYRHARFMPRWASRILLEITEIRVERLQDISEADAKAEGVDARPFPGPWWQGYMHMDDGELIHQQYVGESAPDWMIEPKLMKPTPHLDLSAVDMYRALWESINGTGSWNDNPFVWVIIFRRTEQ